MTSELKRCCRGDRCVDPNGPYLPLVRFSHNRHEQDGLCAECKACRAMIAKRQHDRYTRDQYRKTSKSKATVKRHRQTEHGRDVVRRAREKFRKTVHSKAKELARQGANYEQAVIAYNNPQSICEICGCHIEGRTQHLDHDHRTTNIRGWLCNKCNLMLGLVHDDIERLQAMIQYLKKYNIT